jgi:glycosyltransferase involved in cell wall biosynthesis
MEIKWAKSHSLTGVLVNGQVEDAREFMLENHVLLVPLFSGSGIRIKILEAMFLGRAVISTKLGVEGLNCLDGVHYIEANNEEEFSSAICDLAKNPEKAEQLAINAQQWAQSNFDNKLLIGDLISFYETLLLE